MNTTIIMPMTIQMLLKNKVRQSTIMAIAKKLKNNTLMKIKSKLKYLKDIMLQLFQLAMLQ